MVRILAVDDERNLLLTLQSRIKLSKQPIEFFCFGIDVEPLSTEQEKFEEEVGDAFISYAQKESILNFDIILLDYAIPKKNAKVILNTLKDIALPPVIIMSANAVATHNHILDILRSGQAKRYIYKNSPLFENELTIYANNILEESYTHKISDVLEELKQEEFNTFEDFAKKFARTFMTRLSYTYVVVHKYDVERRTLITVNEIKGISLEKEIDRKYDSKLFDILESDDGYMIDNHFNLTEYSPLKQRFGDTIQSLIIRIGSKQSPHGIVNIFRENRDIFLTDFLVRSIKKSIDNLNSSIVIRLEQTEIINKVLSFLANIMHESDEKKILNDYTRLVHQRYNKNNLRNKTTLKVVRPGKDRLELVAIGDNLELSRCLFNLKLTDNLIESISFRENISILTYDSRDMDEVRSRLQEVYKKIYGFEIESSLKIKFHLHQTSKELEMRSGLCIPISSFRNDGQGAVFGVINLESAEKNYYNIKMMKELFNISQVVGGRIEAIRNQKLLDGLLESSRTLDQKTRLNIVTNVLKEYLGFFSLSIFNVEANSKLKFDNIIIDDDKINNAEVQQAYKKLLKSGKEFKETALAQAYEYFKQGYSIFYIPDLEEVPLYILGKFQDKKLITSSKSITNKTLKVYHKDFYDVKSYYAQAIRYNQELMGILVLEFKVSNPMIHYDLSIIERVTELLGVIYLSSDEKFKDEIRDHYIQDFIRGFQSNFRHIVFNHYNEAKPYFNKEKSPEIENAFREILNASRHYDRVMETGSYKVIVDSIIDEFLNNKKIKIEKSIEDFKVFDKRKEFFYLIFFHIFNNAKAILENIENPSVRIESYIKNDLLYIKVFDNGGLPKNSKRIFELNYSERHNKGGFGLYHLREKISEKGGEIVFLEESKKYFRITIPLERVGEKYEK